MQQARRVALNSLALYFNMGVNVLVMLLATRFALQALGQVEYGLYALVANVVAMFAFLGAAMATATQRFLNFSIGQGESVERQGEIFYASAVIHLGLAFVLFLVVGAVGAVCVGCVLQIPDGYTLRSMIVLFTMTAGLVCTVLSVPYDAAMNAHEHICQIAFINVAEGLLKLAASAAILFLPSERLTLYALLVLLAAAVGYALKRTYARRRYAECRYHLGRGRLDRPLLRQLASFAGWNLLGNGASILRYQGAAVLLNVFFGVVVNAAYGLSQQVNGFMLFFAGSIVRPLRPLLAKAAGAGQTEAVERLASTTSRFALLTLALVATPLYVCMPLVLRLWLHTPTGGVPAETLMFCRSFLLLALLMQLSIGLIVSLDSVGRIRQLHLWASVLHVAPLVAGALLFLHGEPPVVIMLCVLAEEAVAALVRLWLARRYAGIHALRYALRVWLPCLATLLLGYALCALLFGSDVTSLRSALLLTLLHTLLLLVLAPVLCLSRGERAALRRILTHD